VIFGPYEARAFQCGAVRRSIGEFFGIPGSIDVHSQRHRGVGVEGGMSRRRGGIHAPSNECWTSARWEIPLIILRDQKAILGTASKKGKTAVDMPTLPACLIFVMSD
jgi:hypothetical protein